MEFRFGKFLVDDTVDPNTIYLIGMRYKPIPLAPGKSINDLSIEEQIELGIDWESTGKASAVITNIGNPNESKSS